MGRKKLFNKGGVNLDTKEGPFLKVKLNKQELNDLIATQKEYEEKIKNVEFDLKKTTEETEREDKKNIAKQNDEIKINTLNEKSRHHFIQTLGKIIYSLGTILYQLIRFICIVIKECAEFFIKLGSLIVNVLGVGKGTVLRYVLAILFFFLIFFGI